MNFLNYSIEGKIFTEILEFFRIFTVLNIWKNKYLRFRDELLKAHLEEWR